MQNFSDNRLALYAPPDHQHSIAALRGLELLAPQCAPRDLVTVALDYVERYEGDILQVEVAQRELVVALSLARHRDDDDAVVRLVTGLAPILHRMSDRALAEQILRLGIAASRQKRATQQQALFVNQLGSLLVSHGRYDHGWRLWHAGLRLARATRAGDGLWNPLAQFVLIADILGDYDAVKHFYATIPEDNADGHLVARFIRGFYAHSHNDPDQAYADYTACLRLFAQQPSYGQRAPVRQLFAFTVQVELARLQGAYARARALAETVHALAGLYSDRYSAAEMLLDHAWYSYRQGQFADVQMVYERLRILAHQADVPHILHSSRIIEQRLALSAPLSALPAASDQPRMIAAKIATTQWSLLSAREAEVMRLVAAGLANQDIARHLVVTTATVKKHLEHIFVKLDVHSRTAAIAKLAPLGNTNSPFGE